MTGIVVGSTTSALAITVRQEYLYLDAPEIGVVYGSTANQAAKLETALNMAADAGGGTVLVGGKLRAGATEIHPPVQGSGRGAVRLLGIGSAGEWAESPSGIYWDTDVGGSAPLPGDYAGTSGAIRFSANSLPIRVEKLTLQGPSPGGIAIGDMPAKMYGLLMPTKCVIDDVRILGFGAAVGYINDHQVYRDCDFRGNGYAFDFMDNPDGGIGDLLVDRCDMNDQTRATIALSAGNAITNARFIQCHAGAAPFGVYRYAGQAGVARGGQAMQGVVFDNSSWEYCGNAMIYDEAGGGSFVNIGFDSPGEFGTGGSAKWPGKPWPMAKIHIDSGEGFHWRLGPIIPQSDDPTQPVISAKTFLKFRIDDPVPVFDAAVNNSHPTFELRSGGSKFAAGAIGSVATPDGLMLGALEATETVARGSLVEMVGTNQLRESRNGLSSQIVGVSLTDYAAGAMCVYAIAGARSGLVVRNASGSTIGNGALFTPDGSHQGCVKAAASLNDRIIGRAHDGAITSGTTGPAMLSG